MSVWGGGFTGCTSGQGRGAAQREGGLGGPITKTPSDGRGTMTQVRIPCGWGWGKFARGFVAMNCMHMMQELQWPPEGGDAYLVAVLPNALRRCRA